MRHGTRTLLVLGSALSVLLAAGFVVFAREATRAPAGEVPGADGVVALTGIHQRIREAGRLLAQRKARRLLISGVNRSIGREELRRLAGVDGALFDCCVDIGYEAQDTAGNAEEARAWVAAHGFASLIVVTSDYHMPRSLAELGRELPQTRLIPYPVAAKRRSGWPGYAGKARTLAAEYLKFIPSAVRLAGARLMRAIGARAALDGARAAPAGAART